MKGLTARQKEILDFIAEYSREYLYPPTLEEIANHFGVAIGTVQTHVDALKRKNALFRESGRSRSLQVRRGDIENVDRSIVRIPVVGTVAAGFPIDSEESVSASISLGGDFLNRNALYFACKVRGDSMTGDGIFDGDIAVIEKTAEFHDGQIVLAVIDNGITLKHFYKEPSRIRLEASNPAYPPIFCLNARIAGRLAKLLRSY